MRASEMARLTATVVLPTPPFPLATAPRFFTPAIGIFSAWPIGRVGIEGGVGGISFLFQSLHSPQNPLIKTAAVPARRTKVSGRSSSSVLYGPPVQVAHSNDSSPAASRQ